MVRKQNLSETGLDGAGGTGRGGRVWRPRPVLGLSAVCSRRGWCWGFRLVGGRKSFTHLLKEMSCPCWALLPLVRPSTSTDTVVEAGGHQGAQRGVYGLRHGGALAGTWRQLLRPFFFLIILSKAPLGACFPQATGAVGREEAEWTEGEERRRRGGVR